MKITNSTIHSVNYFKLYIKFIIVFLLSLFLVLNTNAQCSSSAGTNTGSLTPTTSWQTVGGVDRGEYFTFAATSCNAYTFTFCSNGGTASFNSQITITDNVTGTTTYAFNDDFCGTASEVTFTPSVSATYRVFITRFNCNSGGAGTGATLAYRYVAQNISTTQYSLVDDAVAAAPGCVTLTANSNDQRGCAWDVNSTLDFTAGFTYDFTVNLGSSDAGADGMTFTIQNDPRGLCACGTAGGSLGTGGVTNSLVVELDTYLNTEDRDDFSSSFIGCFGAEEPDHLDIWVNGIINPDLDSDCNLTSAGERVIPTAVRLQNPPGTNYNIENGLDHILRISWIPNTLTAQLLNAAGTITYGTVSHTFDPMTVFGTNTPYFGFTASTGGLSNQQSICLPSVLLPVTLTGFKITCTAQKNIVSWSTFSEINSSHFILEHSTDGINYNFTARINAAGTSNSELNYSFEHFLSATNVYYRLFQYDLNGGYKLYGPVSSACNETGGFMIHPNPATPDGAITISITGDPEEINNITVYDKLGRIIYVTDIIEQKIIIQTNNLSTGIYTVLFNYKYKTETKRFVINKF